MHQVLIENAIFHAKHGLYKEEGIIGGKFEVNLSLDTDFTVAAESDDLNGTINYVAVFSVIEEEMKQPSKLIEHLGHRIVRRLKSEFSEIKRVRLKLSKYHPPISGEVEKVSVVIEE